MTESERKGAAISQAVYEPFVVTVNKLLALAPEAVETLARNLNCGRPADENKAATALLDHTLKGLHLTHLENRLEELEKCMDDWEAKKSREPAFRARGDAMGTEVAGAAEAVDTENLPADWPQGFSA